MQFSIDRRKRQRKLLSSSSPAAGSLLALFGNQEVDDQSSSARTTQATRRPPITTTTPVKRLKATATSSSAAPDEILRGALSHGSLVSLKARQELQPLKSSISRRPDIHRKKAGNSAASPRPSIRAAKNKREIQSPLVDDNRLKWDKREKPDRDNSGESSSSSVASLSGAKAKETGNRKRCNQPSSGKNDRQLESLGQQSLGSGYRANSDSDDSSNQRSSSPSTRKGDFAARSNRKRPPSRSYASPAIPQIPDKTKKRAFLLHVAPLSKRPDLSESPDACHLAPLSSSRARTNGFSAHPDPPRVRQRESGQSRVESGSDTDLSFHGSDDGSHPSDDGEMWESLGGFIDDMSGNKPVRNSTAKFGMEVIEDEYRRVRGKGQSMYSTVSPRRSRSLSLAQVKAEICKLVRVELRTQSLPNLYIRVEDPCNGSLAKRTEEREARTKAEGALALRLAKRRDRLAKKAEELEKRIESLDEKLNEIPADIYSIHPDLQCDAPPADDGNSPRGSSPRGKGQPVKFRPAPAGTVDIFLGALFPSSAD